MQPELVQQRHKRLNREQQGISLFVRETESKFADYGLSANSRKIRQEMCVDIAANNLRYIHYY